jgi:hypothetical protein
MSAGLIRKSRKWVSATAKIRQEGSGIERQADGGVPTPLARAAGYRNQER